MDNPESPEAKALALALEKNKQNIQSISNDLSNLRSDLNQSLSRSLNKEGKSSNEKSSQELEEKTDSSSQPALQANNQNGGESSFFMDKDKRSYLKKNEVNLGYMTRNLDTTYLIKAQNNFSFIGINYRFINSLDYANTSKAILNLSYKKFLNINKGEYQIPNYLGAGLAYLGEPTFLPFDFSLGLFFENQFFINLAEYNTGLKVADSKLLWVNLTIERAFHVKNVEFILRILYGQTIFTRTEFFSDSVLNITGTKYGAGIDTLYKRIRVGVSYTMDDFSSDSFTEFSMKQRSMEFTISYLF